MKHIPVSSATQADFFLFVSAVLKLFPICQDPKIGSQLSVPAASGLMIASDQPVECSDKLSASDWMVITALWALIGWYHDHVVLLADGMTFTVSVTGCHHRARWLQPRLWLIFLFTPLGSFSRSAGRTQLNRAVSYEVTVRLRFTDLNERFMMFNDMFSRVAVYFSRRGKSSRSMCNVNIKHCVVVVGHLTNTCLQTD